MTTVSQGQALSSQGRGWIRRRADAILVAASALLVGVGLGSGPLSLPGLALLGLAGLALGLGLLYWIPEALVVLAPAVMPLPPIRYFFGFEIILACLALGVVLQGARTNNPWLSRLTDVEGSSLLLTAWAVISGLWCANPAHYLIGVRLFLLSVAAFWTAFRLSLMLRPMWFELGVIAGTASLALAAILRRFVTGLSSEQALLHRGEATNLGWGTANYIAALLLLMAPWVFHAALHAPKRWLRVAAWSALALAAAAQVTIVSRGALALFAGGLVWQLLLAGPRRRPLAAMVTLAGLVLLVAGPWGGDIVHRFTSARELGSWTIRIWNWQEAWRRTVEHLPWGIGLYQSTTQPDRLGPTDPHNYWLVLSSELGVLGVAGWLLLSALLWRRIRFLAGDPALRNQGAALQVCFWLAQLNCLFEPTFTGAHYRFLFFWIMGFALGRYGTTGRLEGPTSPATTPGSGAPSSTDR